MAVVKRESRVSNYTVTDVVLVVGLGVLGGIINSTISSIPHNHFQLWGAQVPYASFFTVMPVLAMLLTRKAGTALATALVYGAVQALFRGDAANILTGLEEGLGAEMVFALFRYRNFSILPAFLAGGIGAKTLGNLWSAVAPASAPAGNHMMMGGMPAAPAATYPAWQTFLGAEILAFTAVGILSGIVGWAIAKLVERTQLVERMRSRLDHAPAQPQKVAN